MEIPTSKQKLIQVDRKFYTKFLLVHFAGVRESERERENLKFSRVGERNASAEERKITKKK